MPLQPHQLVAAATASAGPAGRGKVAYLLRKGARLSVAEQRLADDLRSRPAPTLVAVPEVPSAPGRPSKDGHRPLSVGDIAWLDGLPADPARVPMDDAQHLATLAAAVPSGTSDERLVNAKWVPVHDHHAARRADAVAVNSRAQAATPPPASAVPAVAEAVCRANPTLSAGEAVARAQALLRGAPDQPPTTGGNAA